MSPVIATLYVMALGLIGIASVAIVLYHGYQETLTQCLALAIVALGAVTEIHSVINRTGNDVGLLTLVIGIGMFAVATVLRMSDTSMRKIKS